MTEALLPSRFAGCLLGCAVGDALGTFAFHRMPGRLVNLEDGDRLTYTDDTAMAIGVAETLALHRRLDEKLLGDRFLANWRREPGRGYAPGPVKVFELVADKGIPWSKAAQMLYGWQGSLGNGGAMRAGPVGLFFHDAADLYEQARVSSIVTHAHPVGVDGTAIVARAVAGAFTLLPGGRFDPAGFAGMLEGFARTSEFRQKMRRVADLVRGNASDRDAADELGRSFRAEESVPFAVYSFLAHPGSFQECILCAVGNGGDRDTVGAMAGQIAGAFHGDAGIPGGWLEKLENRDYLRKLGLLLCHAKAERGREGGAG